MLHPSIVLWPHKLLMTVLLGSQAWEIQINLALKWSIVSKCLKSVANYEHFQ